MSVGDYVCLSVSMYVGIYVSKIFCMYASIYGLYVRICICRHVWA